MGQEQVRRNWLLLEVKYDMKVVHVEKMKLMDCVLNVLFLPNILNYVKILKSEKVDRCKKSLLIYISLN